MSRAAAGIEVASPMRCAGTAENAVGYDSGFPALYLFDSGRAVRLYAADHTIKDEDRDAKGRVAKEFFLAFFNADCSKIAN